MPNLPSKDYWRKRFRILEQASNDYGLETYYRIEPSFNKAMRNIRKEIEYWISRFAKNNKVSMQEARKILNKNELKEFKWDVDDYITYCKENELDGRWQKQLENASAKFHISRLEALELSIQQNIEVVFGNELDEIDKMAKKILTENYYQSIFEVQKGFNIGFRIGQVNQRELNKIITKPWTTDRKSFSDRIWTAKQQMIGDLHQELVRTCLQGKGPDEAIKHMTMFVDDKIKSAKSAASRLVQTEQAYFHSVSQKEAFEELDIDKYQIEATIDSKTSEICQHMDGQIFPTKEYEPGATAPPFHPNCRTTTVPYFEEYKGTVRAARDENEKTYYIPANMTYKEWKKKMIKQT